MVRCGHCNAALTRGAAFCMDCGQPVPGAAAKEADPLLAKTEISPELAAAAAAAVALSHGAGDATVNDPRDPLGRFANVPLTNDTILDPARRGSGPTDLLLQARFAAGGPPSAPPDPVEPTQTELPPPPEPSGGRSGDRRSGSGSPRSGSGSEPGGPPLFERPELPSEAPSLPLAPSLLPPMAARGASPDPSQPEAPPATPTPVRSAHPSEAPLPGETIDGYTIEMEVGRGGMGRVYRASHGVTGQTVALKMLAPQVSAGRARERFINEARVLARLDHPNLVPLLGFIDDPRGLFIVMPFVRGITLEEMMRKQGRLTLPVACELFAGLCAGVAHVHAEGMLHRDLKPGNVIVQSDGVPRITDFGIAREAGSAGMTAAGMVIGTAEYLAPELASGTVRDDPRSDQYALGCLLYQMLAGQPPFRHPNVGKLLLKQIQDPPPPPRTIAPDLPKAVETVILKALEKKPERRYPDVMALSAALRDAVQGSGVAEAQAGDAVTQPPASADGGGWVWASLGALLLGGAGFAAWWFLLRG